MIENSFVNIESDGKFVTVNYFEDGEVREGPASLPARYASFAAIIQYAETQFNGPKLDIQKRAQIQGLLGAPWPTAKLRFYWKDCSA
jgi:hypothetical protein